MKIYVVVVTYSFGETCRAVVGFLDKRNAEDFAGNQEALENGFGKGAVAEVQPVKVLDSRDRNPSKKRLMR